MLCRLSYWPSHSRRPRPETDYLDNRSLDALPPARKFELSSRLPVEYVSATETTILAQLHAIRVRRAVLRRRIGASFAIGTCQRDYLPLLFARHTVGVENPFVGGVPEFFQRGSDCRKAIKLMNSVRPLLRPVIGYSRTSVVIPDATVFPPSRMANRRPRSMAIGVIN